MKQDWTVKGTIHYRDGMQEGFSGEWPARTLDELDRIAEETVAGQMKRRKVRGCSVTATATGAGFSVVQRIQWK